MARTASRSSGGPGVLMIPVQRGHPTTAASRWRLNVSHSGRSSRSLRGQTGPMLGTRRCRSARSRPTGLVRPRVEVVVQRRQPRVEPDDLGLRSVCSRGGALRRFVRRSTWRPGPPPEGAGVQPGRPAGPGCRTPASATGPRPGPEGLGRPTARGLGNVASRAGIAPGRLAAATRRPGAGARRHAPSRGGTA